MAKEVKAKVSINLDEEVVKKHPFKPRREVRDGLCVGKLINISVVENEVPREKKDGTESAYEYAGLTVPSLKLEFENLQDKHDNVERHFTYMESVIVNRKNDGAPVEDEDLNSLYSSMWKRIKHVCDVVTNGKFSSNMEVRTATQNLLNLAGQAEAPKMAEAFKGFFTAIVNCVTAGNNGKTFTKDEKGKFKFFNMKLLPNHPSRQWYTFPSSKFGIGDGFIELAQFDAQGNWLNVHGIEIKVNESLELAAANAKGGKDIHANTDGLPDGSVNLQELMKQA